MRFDQAFTVPVGADRVFAALNDVPLLASCMRGVELQGQEGERHLGTFRARLGPISLAYSGSAWFEERDAEARRFRAVATASETSGAGTAGATITGQVLPRDSDSAEVQLEVDLQIAGRPAQFGRGLITDVSQQLAEDFARQLSTALSPEGVQEPAAARVGDADVMSAWDLVPAKLRYAGAAGLGLAVGFLLGLVAARSPRRA